MPCFGVKWSQMWTMDYNSTIIIHAQNKQNGGNTNQKDTTTWTKKEPWGFILLCATMQNYILT
jgi:hypothetical protein